MIPHSHRRNSWSGLRCPPERPTANCLRSNVRRFSRRLMSSAYVNILASVPAALICRPKPGGLRRSFLFRARRRRRDRRVHRHYSRWLIFLGIAVGRSAQGVYVTGRSRRASADLAHCRRLWLLGASIELWLRTSSMMRSAWATPNGRCWRRLLRLCAGAFRLGLRRVFSARLDGPCAGSRRRKSLMSISRRFFCRPLIGLYWLRLR